MPKKIRFLLAVLGLILLTGVWIYYDRQAEYTANLDSRTFNAALAGKINSFEPHLANSHEEKLIASALYEGLVYYDEDSTGVKPLIAADWKYSRDGKSLTLNLKSGVKFHNGKQVMAQDVKAAWENSFSNTREWSNIGLFLSIEGSQERLDGKAAEISGIKAINSHTLKVSFTQPNAAFIYMLSSPVFWVYDIEGESAPPPGTGPFILHENQENQEIIITRNDKYHRGRAKLSSINFKIYATPAEALKEYKAGKIDYLDSVPLKEVAGFKEDPQYKKLLIQKPLLSTYALAFNNNKKPFAGNYLLRRAINYAIDRKLIAEEVTGGSYLTVSGIVPLSMPGYQHDMVGYTYDPNKAQELLGEAGYPLGERLPELILTYNEDPGHEMVAEFIAAQLGELGVRVQLQSVEWDYYKKQLSQSNMAFFRLEWMADYPDPDSFLYSLYHSGNIGITNYCNYNNPQVDKILDASRRETESQQERRKLLNRAEEIIIDDAPCLWLFQSVTNKLIGANTNSLKVNSMDMLNWHEIELLKPALEKGPEGATGDNKDKA